MQEVERRRKPKPSGHAQDDYMDVGDRAKQEPDDYMDVGDRAKQEPDDYRDVGGRATPGAGARAERRFEGA